MTNLERIISTPIMLPTQRSAFVSLTHILISPNIILNDL